MSAKVIDGKKLSDEIKLKIKNEVEAKFSAEEKPALAVVLVGEDPASKVYVNNKKKACEYVGFKSLEYKLSPDTSEEELLKLVDELNENKEINGILVQLPVPKHIDDKKVLNRISPIKDVDGFHPENVGKMLVGDDAFLPCTPAGIIELIKSTGITMEGKDCVILGRSNIVGKPAAILMLEQNATVTVCHSRTKDLAGKTRAADIIIAAIGIPEFLKGDMIKEGSVLIDVGINRLDNGKLVGDIAYDECAEKAAAITPVPGGVGPMTIAMLMSNCLQAYYMQNK